jgi:hypothetical protein
MLAPILDFGQDELLDSHDPEGILRLSMFWGLASFLCITKFYAAYIAPPRFTFSPPIPPPVFHN